MSCPEDVDNSTVYIFFLIDFTIDFTPERGVIPPIRQRYPLRSRVSGCVAIAVLFRSTYSSTQIAIAYMLVMPCPNLKMALA